jgi:hypothetical protein
MRPPYSGGLTINRYSFHKLPSDPAATVPIAAAFVLTELIAFVRTPAPVVLVHDDTRVTRVLI